MKFEIKKYTAELQENWDQFINTAKNGLFFFHRDFIEYHSDRFKDHSLLIYKKNKIIAIFPASENGKEISSHGGLTFGSLVLSFDVKAAEVILILKEIKIYFKNLNFSKIIYKAIPYIFNKYPSDEDLYALQLEGAKIIRRDISSVIELSIPIKFSETKRQLIKKCAALNLKISEQNDFENYWSLLSNVLLKFNSKPTHAIEEIFYLKERYPENIKLFTVEKESDILAGIVIFDFGNVVHTQYMAAADEGRKLGALDYITSFLIEKYKDRKYYSFGISTEDQGRYLNEGLIQQKENMGARGVTLDYYEILL